MTAFKKKVGGNTRTDTIGLDGRGGTARSPSNPDKSINQTPVNAIKNESPEITAARDSIPDIPVDKLFEIEHDDGSTDTGSAAELMARADQEAAFAEQSDAATSSAITCFLKFGDL